MQNGIVKWWNSTKGFGFIVSEDGDDFFVHISDLFPGTETLREGQHVGFDIHQDQKGAKAINVRGY